MTEPARSDDVSDPKPSLLARGNPLRRKRGGITAAIGGAGALLVMAQNGHMPLGVPIGLALVLVCAWGVMDLLGSFDDRDDERVAHTRTLASLGRPIASVLALFVAFAGALWGGQSGIGPQLLWGALVTVTFLLFVIALFRLGRALGPWATDETGKERPLLRRHGFWVVAAGALLYLPMMGSYSLWDPWETHYGEVAREILSRDDWISLWWVQQGWFWSKPILNFWMQALAMDALGTHYQPGQMLLGPAGHFAHPEWVVRAPNVLLTILALYLIYKGVAKVFGRRAGMLGALVLATMPDWFFLAHQTMTDMPFVASMTAAMGLLLLGVNTDEDRKTRLYEVDAGKFKVRLSGWHLAFGTILLCAIPQILYLLSRNVELVLHGNGPYGFNVHYDEFRSGSAGNCGLPGSETCNLVSPASIPKNVLPHPAGFGPNVLRTFGAFEPFLQGIVWAIVLGGLLYVNWGERRVRRLVYLGAWFFAAIATMGKGPAGFALPVLCVFAYLATKQRWSELLKVEMVSGLLIVIAIAVPWWVAMYVRHGAPFTDELFFQNMFNRAFGHVHDTNEGDDTSFRFYLWQLGYALFPWTGLAPLGLVWWARRGDSADQGRADASVFLVMWFVFGFALFSFMGTKFHHYIFPAVPPVAMLIGIVLHDMLGDRAPVTDPGEVRRMAHERIMLAGAAVAGALVVALVTRDLGRAAQAGEPPGAIRLLQLFTYNYRRTWPDTIDFSTTLTVFGAIAGVLMLVLAVPRIRRGAVTAMLAFGGAWAVWGLDVYMARMSPHWGQHEVIEAYYANRAGPDEPLVAYQMNWKGENFYAGNHLAVFVSTGPAFTSWLKQQRDKGVRVMYFVTEPSRMGGLRNEVAGKAYRELTDRALCNKFVMVRAEL